MTGYKKKQMSKYKIKNYPLKNKLVQKKKYLVKKNNASLFSNFFL